MESLIRIRDHIERKDVFEIDEIPEDSTTVYSSNEMIDGVFSFVELIEFQNKYFISIKTHPSIDNDQNTIYQHYKYQVGNAGAVDSLLSAVMKYANI